MKFFSFLLFFGVNAWAGTTLDNSANQQAARYLNQLRTHADMTVFNTDDTLSKAAQNHASYLIDNNRVGHGEQVGETGFTGESPSERVVFAGFPTLSVSENVAVGQKTSTEAIDGLMGSIYHRFGFLSFEQDLLGIGIARATTDAVSAAYVFNMANAGIALLCQQPETIEPVGTFIVQVCYPNIKLTETAYASAKTAVQGHNPLIVQWPPVTARDIPPAFFEESPDPLPDLSVSGYPVSVQFNPLGFQQIGLEQFRLFDATGKEITDTRLLDETRDPNKRFSPLQFALFPLQRLAWSSQYRVLFAYTVDDGELQTLDWTFTTRDLGMPIFTTVAKGESVKIPANQAEAFALYVPPTAQFASIGQIQWSGNGTQVDFIDQNTLKIHLTANINQQSNFNLSGGRSFSLQVVEALAHLDNTPPHALFKITPDTGDAPLTVHLDGSDSLDSDGSIQAYRWEAVLNDLKIQAVGKKADIILPQAGQYLLRLTVTDDDGANSSRQQVVEVKTAVSHAETVMLPTLTSPRLKSSYQSGELLTVALTEEAGQRQEAVDLWVAVQLPVQQIIFLSQQGLSLEPQAAKTNIALTDTQHKLFEFNVLPDLTGHYTLYALYVVAGKNPFKEAFIIHRSNLLIKNFDIQ